MSEPVSYSVSNAEKDPAPAYLKIYRDWEKTSIERYSVGNWKPDPRSWGISHLKGLRVSRSMTDRQHRRHVEAILFVIETIEHERHPDIMPTPDRIVR